MKICIISTSGDWGPIHTIYNSLKNYTKHDISVVLKRNDPYGFSELCKSFAIFYFKRARACIRRIVEADCLFIFGLPTIEKFLPIKICESVYWKEHKISKPLNYIKTKKIIYFDACSDIIKRNEAVNNIYKQWPMNTFFYFLDIKDYIKVNVKKMFPYVPPLSMKYFPFLKEKKRNNNQIVLGHSPGTKLKTDEKGTSFIEGVFKSVKSKYENVSYKIIENMGNEECIKMKYSCDIFVDQIIDNSMNNCDPPYLGGQGKSGIEAMVLGCLAMTSYRDLSSEPYFPNTPMVQVSKDNLEQTIEKFIIDKDLRDNVINKQKKWVKKYLNDKFFASYIREKIK